MTAIWSVQVLHKPPFTDLPVHLARDLQFLSSYLNPAPLPGSNSWPCQTAWWFCDTHKWGLRRDHPTCFHLQTKPGCKAESPEEKDYGTNPLCHLASTVQKSYSDTANASFLDALWLCNNHPPKTCSVSQQCQPKFWSHCIMLPSCGKYFLQVKFSLQLKYYIKSSDEQLSTTQRLLQLKNVVAAAVVITKFIHIRIYSFILSSVQHSFKEVHL